MNHYNIWADVDMDVDVALIRYAASDSESDSVLGWF